MANYTKATNFASKDSLLTGNPSKLIRGSEIDAEYNAIATAVATKADTNSPTFTGTPLVPTATTGTNTQQVASTAFVSTAVTNGLATLGTMSTQNANNVNITGGAISGLSSALPVLSGGTGVTTATGTGSVVRATSPTLTTPNLGTPTAVVLTNATGTANSLNAGIGVNQTWQLPTRSTGTTYQNTTGKPIQVCFSFTASGNQRTITGDVSTDGTNWITIIKAFNSNDDDINGGNVSFIVPNNLYYRISSNGASSIIWAELR